METSLHLEIVTPDKAVLDTQADFVSVPGLEGMFGVLPNHTPFLSVLGTGCLHYTQGGKTFYVSLSGGFAEVSDNLVRILADVAECAEDIDVDRAMKARQRALDRLDAARRGEKINTIRAEASLKRAINRLDANRVCVI